MKVLGFVTKLFDFTFGVHPFKRRQVDHIEDHFQALHLGIFLDTSGLKTFRPFNNADLIDRR